MAPLGYNERRLHEGHLEELVRHWQRSHGLLADGKAGEKTLATIEAAMAVDGAGDLPDQLSGPLEDGSWPPFDNPIQIPHNRAEIVALLGHPGPVAKLDRKWKRACIVSLRDLPGVSRWMNVHRKVEPMLREGLRRAHDATGYEITRGDSWVHRYLRHNARNGLSLHSFGAAVDINPHLNQARSFELGMAPAPWSDEWLAIWPNGVSRDFVLAMESVGWTWGGAWGSRGGDLAKRVKRARRIDPQHFELRDR